MMNRSTTSTPLSYPSSDPYISSLPNMMSFASYQEEWNTHDNNQNPMIPNTNFDLQLPPPLALPLMNMTTSHHGFPFYSPLASDQYHHSFIKREEGTAANLCGSTSSARIGLNLGHRTYFSSEDALTIDRLLTARAHHQQPPRCQAEGCKADLSGSKHYHRRHKVCEFHSKATVVISNGMQQRFCQQCSRFHVLAEFDESKRSCRKRLADHNRRRRKPPQNTTYSSEKTKLCPTTATTSKDSSNNCTATATRTTNGGGIEGNREHNKAILSLGRGSQQQPGQYNYHHHHFSPPPATSSNNFYHQQSLFGSTSNDASHQSNNELHPNMFEVDFM